jgi:hypothetical protein
VEGLGNAFDCYCLGMDEKNERKVWAMLLQVCRQYQAQYFYMAPKFPRSLPFDDQVTYSNIYIRICVVSGTVQIDISLPDLDPHLGPANPNPLQYIFVELSKFKTIPLVMLYLEITVKIAK